MQHRSCEERVARRPVAWVAVMFAAALTVSSARAAQVEYGFDALLDTGPLQGTGFVGTFSFDTAAETGVGREFLSLTSLDFTLLGAHFTRDDIGQGGQVILDEGRFSTFTAAFFPTSRSPVSDIAFGFGGPGVIGYIVPPNMFGSGHYEILAAAVPEPRVSSLTTAGLAAVLAAARVRKARPSSAASPRS